MCKNHGIIEITQVHCNDLIELYYNNYTLVAIFDYF